MESKLHNTPVIVLNFILFFKLRLFRLNTSSSNSERLSLNYYKFYFIFLAYLHSSFVSDVMRYACLLTPSQPKCCASITRFHLSRGRCWGHESVCTLWTRTIPDTCTRKTC